MKIDPLASETKTLTFPPGTTGHSCYCMPQDGGAYRMFDDVLFWLEDGEAKSEAPPRKHWIEPGNGHRRSTPTAEEYARGALKDLRKPSRRAWKEVRFLEEWLRRVEGHDD